MVDRITRRKFVLVLGAASMGVMAAACSSAAPAQPTTAPAKPAAPAQPTAATAPQQAPAAPSKPSGFQAEWDALVDAAKKEGKVVVQNPAGAGYRPAMDEFTKAFGIEVEQQAYPDAATYIPKIKGEREAGIYSIDVIASTVTPLLQILKPEGIIDPIKPLFIHPEVLDDKVWYGGIEARWADIEKSYVFRHQVNVTRAVYINTKLVKEDEIKKVEDLLDPKWKGKIVTSDLAQGYVYTPSTVLRELKGEDFLRRLFVDQEPQMIRDRRQAVETLVRGAAPIGFGIHPVIMRDFVSEGLAGDVKNPEVEGATYGGGEIVGLYKNAPHPNAAKLYINWMLSKDGQTAWSTHLKVNSARTDVPVVDPSKTPGTAKIIDPTQEEWMVRTGETQAFLKSLTT